MFYSLGKKNQKNLRGVWQPSPHLYVRGLIDVERVLFLIWLCEPSMFTTTFTLKLGSIFFFPLGNSSLYNRKHESDQLPSVNPTQAISPRELWGKDLV